MEAVRLLCNEIINVMRAVFIVATTIAAVNGTKTHTFVTITVINDVNAASDATYDLHSDSTSAAFASTSKPFAVEPFTDSFSHRPSTRSSYFNEIILNKLR